MQGILNNVTTNDTFTWTKQVKGDWATATFEDYTSVDGGKVSSISSSGSDSLLVDTGTGGATYRRPSVASLNIGDCFTDPSHRGLEISFKADMSAISKSPINGDYPKLIPGFLFNTDKAFKDVTDIKLFTSGYDSVSDIQKVSFDDASNESAILFPFELGQASSSNQFKISVLGKLVSEMPTTYSNPDRFSQSPTGSFSSLPEVMDGIKEITVRLELTPLNVLLMGLYVDGELVRLMHSFYPIDASILANSQVRAIFYNEFSDQSLTYGITDIKVSQLVAPVNYPKAIASDQVDLSASRVKMLSLGDLVKAGVYMKTKEDAMQVFKTFLTGAGYNGQGGCNWDLVFEDATRLVFRAKSGVRDYFRLTFSEVSFNGFNFAQFVVECFSSMTSVSSGSDSFKSNNDGAFFLPLNHYSTTLSATTATLYVGASAESRMQNTWSIVASDKTLYGFVKASALIVTTTNPKHSSWAFGFGEYKSIIDNNQYASFIVNTVSSGTTPTYTEGPCPWQRNASREGLIKCRDFSGITFDTISSVPSGYDYSGVETSYGYSSSLQGSPIFFPATISGDLNNRSIIGMLPGYFSMFNRYPTVSTSEVVVDEANFWNLPPCGEIFAEGGRNYMWWYGAGRTSNANSENAAYVTSCGISLADEDWP